MADQTASQSIDRWTLVGVVTCGIPVAAYSSWSQFETARAAGVPAALAWVLPMATDATATVATRAWLKAARGSGLRAYAAFLVIACICLSTGGAALHLLIHGSPWWMKLTVGGLPSLALAALIHLAALMASKPGEKAEPKTKRKTARKADLPATPSQDSLSAPPHVDAESAMTTDAPDYPESPGAVPAASGESPGAVPAASGESGASVVPITAHADKSAVRARMLAHLDAHPDTTGAELDRLFETKDYGRGVVRAWKKHPHPRSQASGE